MVVLISHTANEGRLYIEATPESGQPFGSIHYAREMAYRMPARIEIVAGSVVASVEEQLRKAISCLMQEIKNNGWEVKISQALREI